MTIVKDNRITTYIYDGLGRLVSEEEKLVGQTLFKAAYTFDDFSNRSSMTVTGLSAYTVNYTYDHNNRLLTEVNTAGNQSVTTTYTYDAAGNQLTKTSTDPDVPTETRAYTAAGQLAAVNVGTMYTAYSYWPSGLRLSKGTDVFVWDGANLAYESETETYYLYGTSLFAAKEGTTDRYYLFNGHGDVVQLANSAGTVTKSYEYDAYGNEKNPDSTDTNHLRYCGEYYDTETETYYLRARYYNPRLGRFASEDPARSGLNWYTYCAGNPIMYVDPSGCIIDIDAFWLIKDDILSVLMEITDYELGFNKDGHVEIKSRPNEFQHTKGNELIERLISDDNTVTIKYKTTLLGLDSDKTVPILEDNDKVKYGTEYDCILYFDPYNGKTVLLDIDNETLEKIEEVSPPEIILAHELIHADQYMSGTMYSGSFVISTFQTYYDYDYSVYPKELKLQKHKKTIQINELYAVGILRTWNKNEITENMIREELGLPQRKVY